MSTQQSSPCGAGESADARVNEILAGVEAGGWWADPAMFGTIAHRPELLKTIVPDVRGVLRQRPRRAAHLRADAPQDRADQRLRILHGRAHPGRQGLGAVQGARHARAPAGAVRRPQRARGRGHPARRADRPRPPHRGLAVLGRSCTGVFSNDEIVELVFASGIFNWGNKFNITMQMDAAPETEYLTTGHAVPRSRSWPGDRRGRDGRAAPDLSQVSAAVGTAPYVLVELWGTHCAPCRALRPLLEKLAVQRRGLGLHGAQHRGRPRGGRRTYGVRGTPTILLFRDGVEVDRTAGFVMPADLTARMDAVKPLAG